ncbi:unnamed protein product [Dibothriocephalus latus]|uniref:Uncharacterized protein n=1 Tax=Dibothriocephalus latus TaxID=60516 RepID=A0A3P7QFU6_DIBLA|nr:unnamed protein product [Dibothriocephalus latus]
MVSFVDVPMTGVDSEDWPLVLITNPKDAGFLLPNKEPTDLIQRSTHIRLDIEPLEEIVTDQNPHSGEAIVGLDRSNDFGRHTIYFSY